MRRIIAAILFGLCLTPSLTSLAGTSGTWDITGGLPWKNRVGPGVMLALGGNDCTDEMCDDDFDTSFGGSFGATAGFFYRFLPNLSAFVDFHFGYINSDVEGMRDDKGFLFQTIVGAEFHAPITGWLDAYLGLGIGFAYLRGTGELVTTDADTSEDFKGVDFELRIGADVYPFSAVPTLGAGLMFRLGMVHWPTTCFDDGTSSKECDDPGDAYWVEKDDLPFLVHFGMTVKYGF